MPNTAGGELVIGPLNQRAQFTGVFLTAATQPQDSFLNGIAADMLPGTSAVP